MEGSPGGVVPQIEAKERNFGHSDPFKQRRTVARR